jgi:glucose/arabinose dehydrogenase
MYLVGKAFFTQGTVILSIYCILALTYTNSGIEEKYFVHATVTDNDVVQNLDENDVVLNPIIKNNPNLKVEEVSDGLDFPTSLAFLGPEDMLVLEKNEGTVKRILNGILLDKPLLDVNVANGGERGMLGIAVAEEDASGEDDNDNNHVTYVFLYYTESTGQVNDDVDGEVINNRLYRYELDHDRQGLVNPRLLLDLPATPGPTHNGGKLVIGPDNNLYLTVGDIGEHDRSDPSTIINIEGGPEPDGRAGILRVTQDGEAVNLAVGQGIEQEEDDVSNILGDEYPLNLYYAYGIRNSFGMDFDPLTGKLWDVETGRNFGEEVNLVEPGFNSGWMNAQGIWELNRMLQARGAALPDDESFISQLVDFDGRGEYSSPEFTWGKMPVTTSGAAFFHSDRLGKQYENDLFVGDFVNGMIFDFELSEDRMQLSFDNNGPLKDKLADKPQELEDIIFGHGFGGITDIKIGPYDGYIYVLSLDRGGDECKPQYPNRSCIPYSSTVEGHIFRIIAAPNQNKPSSTSDTVESNFVSQ